MFFVNTEILSDTRDCSYTHMPNSVCYCICCELDIDNTVLMTRKPGQCPYGSCLDICADDGGPT